METFLTAKQVEELLNVDRTTIYRMQKDGRLSGTKIGKQWRFALKEVEDLLSGTIQSNSNTPTLSPEELPLHCIQPIQDVFAEIAQVGSVTTDKTGNPLTKISNSCDFCKLILGSDEGRQACINSWKQLFNQQENNPEFTTCHAGLKYARARIEVGGKLLAILISGQFHLNQPEPIEEENRLRTLAKKYKIDLDLLTQSAKQITVLEEDKIPQISGWLERVARTFEQISSERVSLTNRLRKISDMSKL